MIISKILVAVDGSTPSLDAAQKAINFAEKYGADLIALHVISSNIRYEYNGDSLTPVFSGPLKEIVSMAMEKGQKYVDEVKEMASSKTLNVRTDVLLAVTSVVKEVVEYAEKQNVDLIVLGTRGMSGFKRMLLGSTASGVIKYSHCPVLVVK